MTQTEGQIVLIQFFTELVNVKADTVTVLCRWEYEEVGCVGVSVWPQSGQADPSVVASLQVRLVSDQERREETEEVVGGCPAGLYWCGDTCYSHNVCHQTSVRPQLLARDTSNPVMLRDRQSQVSQITTTVGNYHAPLGWTEGEHHWSSGGEGPGGDCPGGGAGEL